MQSLQGIMEHYTQTEYDLKLNLLKFVYLKYLIDNGYFSEEHIDEIAVFRVSLETILRFRGYGENITAKDAVLVFSKKTSWP